MPHQVLSPDEDEDLSDLDPPLVAAQSSAVKGKLKGKAAGAQPIIDQLGEEDNDENTNEDVQAKRIMHPAKKKTQSTAPSQLRVSARSGQRTLSAKQQAIGL